MVNCSQLLAFAETGKDIRTIEKANSVAPRYLLRYFGVASPIVVWNVTKQCNLSCRYCYEGATLLPSKDELSYDEATKLMDGLKEMNIPLLVFSGGEPLARGDIFDLFAYARSIGLPFILSTNGTLITQDMAKRIKNAGVSYVGISIDGLEDMHDEMRGSKGSFHKSIEGLRYLIGEGIKTGIRITVTKPNLEEIGNVLDIAVDEGVPRFTVLQLVYSGRGDKFKRWDINKKERRELIGYLVKRAGDLKAIRSATEIVTADNYTDGIYIFNHIKRNNPSAAKDAEKLLLRQSGCPAAEKLMDIDYKGDVHPCPYWTTKTLGNVKNKKIGEIWVDKTNEFLAAMRDKTSHLKGKCGGCGYKSFCGGCRVRAEMIYGDPFAEDPACYLSEEEIHDKLQ